MEILINIDVDDLERAIRFYEEALGLRVARRFDDDFVELAGAATRLFLLRKPSGSIIASGAEERRRYTRHWTPVHLDFVVPDLGPALVRAEGAGAVRNGEIVVEAYGRFAVFSDPFGHGFCLLEFFGRGYAELAEPLPGMAD